MSARLVAFEPAGALALRCIASLASSLLPRVSQWYEALDRLRLKLPSGFKIALHCGFCLWLKLQ